MIAEIMDALAENIRTAYASVTDVDIQVEKGRVLSPTPPTIDIYRADPGRDPSTAGFGEIEGSILLTIRARVAGVDADANYELLLAFADETDDLCIANPVLDDQTLGGLATSVSLDPPSGDVIYADSPGLIGCDWRCTVLPAFS